MNGYVLKRMRIVVAVLALTFIWTAIPANAAKRLAPRVENIILMLDQSSSMKFFYKGVSNLELGGAEKEVLAQSAMIAFNKMIPDLNYTTGVYSFAPFAQFAGMARYNRGNMERTISNINIKYDTYGRMTPMGFGLMDLDPTLNGLSGRTAVVLFTDGDDNLGIDAVDEAKRLQAKYGDRLCFMVVSFADSKHGQDVVTKIAALSKCGCLVEGEDFLRNLSTREAFMRCGIYEWIEDGMAETVVFRSIYFDFDKSNIKSEFFPVLDEGVAMTKNKSNQQVILEGHTDSVGTEQYNQALSQRRADAVKNYFVKKGVSSSRITTRGYGESQPRATNSTAEGRKLNRRTEIKFGPAN